MSDTLDDRDFIAWTEQQTAALRSVDIQSNALDIVHLIEGRETFGRQEVKVHASALWAFNPSDHASLWCRPTETGLCVRGGDVSGPVK